MNTNMDHDTSSLEMTMFTLERHMGSGISKAFLPVSDGI